MISILLVSGFLTIILPDVKNAFANNYMNNDQDGLYLLTGYHTISEYCAAYHGTLRTTNDNNHTPIGCDIYVFDRDK